MQPHWTANLLEKCFLRNDGLSVTLGKTTNGPMWLVSTKSRVLRSYALTVAVEEVMDLADIEFPMPTWWGAEQ